MSNDSRELDHLVSLTRRLGNIRNELGTFYMNTAVNMSADAGDVIPEDLWKKSLESFNAGIRAFEAVEDRYCDLNWENFSSDWETDRAVLCRFSIGFLL